MIVKRDKKGRIQKGNGFKHGLSNSPTYDCWISMKARCFNKNNPAYRFYGQRGVKVCKEWFNFENFLKDMGEVPKGKTLDRTDNNKGYFKDNCRWITIQEQQKNRRDNNIVVGVHFEKSRNKWHADITRQSKKIFLGRFSDFNLAKKVRLQAEIKYAI